MTHPDEPASHDTIADAILIDLTGGWCGWSKVDRYGELYPCDKPSVKRLVNGPELWDNGDLCKYHAPRALKRARAEQAADRVEWTEMQEIRAELVLLPAADGLEQGGE